MHRIATLSLVLVAWLAAAPGGASAQDAPNAVARELERKARAGEPDNGFCARDGARLERLDRPGAAARLNQLLSRNHAATASLLFVVSDAPSGEPVCAYLFFRPAALRGDQKCRPSHIFVCIANQDCRAKLDDSICEMKPGQWD